MQGVKEYDTAMHILMMCLNFMRGISSMIGLAQYLCYELFRS
jgi:hypothetical protein